MTRKTIAICKHCGEEYQTKRSNQIFCSESCRYIHNREKRKLLPKSKMCEWCGVEFVALAKQRIYCSISCQKKSNSNMAAIKRKEYLMNKNIRIARWNLEFKNIWKNNGEKNA